MTEEPKVATQPAPSGDVAELVEEIELSIEERKQGIVHLYDADFESRLLVALTSQQAELEALQDELTQEQRAGDRRAGTILDREMTIDKLHKEIAAHQKQGEA